MTESLVIEERRIRRLTFKPKISSVEIIDEVALDQPTCIFVNGDYHVTLISTSTMKRELATGYLYSEGIIDSAEDILSIKLREKDAHVELKKNVDLRTASVGRMNLIVTACGSSPRGPINQVRSPKIMSSLQVEAEKILQMVTELTKRSQIHIRTGGTHAAMLCSKTGEVLTFAEDVGRHNAIDKVIGSMVLKKKTLSDCVLISSGRQSGEMVQKAVKAQIPIIASMTAPLSSGIKLADMARITLVCFARGKRIQIYTNPERIII